MCKKNIFLITMLATVAGSSTLVEAMKLRNGVKLPGIGQKPKLRKAAKDRAKSAKPSDKRTKKAGSCLFSPLVSTANTIKAAAFGIPTYLFIARPVSKMTLGKTATRMVDLSLCAGAIAGAFYLYNRFSQNTIVKKIEEAKTYLGGLINGVSNKLKAFRNFVTKKFREIDEKISRIEKTTADTNAVVRENHRILARENS